MRLRLQGVHNHVKVRIKLLFRDMLLELNKVNCKVYRHYSSVFGPVFNLPLDRFNHGTNLDMIFVSLHQVNCMVSPTLFLEPGLVLRWFHAQLDS